MKQEITDKSLLESISLGSEKAFRLLYDRHNRLLLS